MQKIQKIKTKKNKVCVGEYIFAINAEISKLMHEQKLSDELMAAKYSVMNAIFFEIAYNWCKCPHCKKKADDIVALLKSHNQAVEKISENHKRVENEIHS